MRIKQNIGLIKSRVRFREPTNLKYPTMVCMEGNAGGDQWGNDRQWIEIETEIRPMYVGWNQMVGRDKIERKHNRRSY